MKLIVGLGNIGKEYENTRHNIGFMVVDELAKRWGVSFNRTDKNAMFAEHRAPEKIMLIKPTTYMNLSGIAVPTSRPFSVSSSGVLYRFALRASQTI